MPDGQHAVRRHASEGDIAAALLARFSDTPGP